MKASNVSYYDTPEAIRNTRANTGSEPNEIHVTKNRVIINWGSIAVRL